MPFSNNMLETACAARDALGGDTARVLRFLEMQRHPCGGYMNRAGQPDLYYTVFGIDCSMALGGAEPGPDLEAYVRTFGNGESLDLIHLACLARCWARLPGPGIDRARKDAWRGLMEEYRTPDGGYAMERGSSTLSVTASFLSAQASSDLGVLPPNALRAFGALSSLGARDGAYGNVPGLAQGTTIATAGVMLLWHRLHFPVDSALKDWLLARCHPEGGFLATPGAPLPDLLSTATALFALRQLERPLDATRRSACLRFVEDLMADSGGFGGHWADDTPDCEYTFYALLSLGCLA